MIGAHSSEEVVFIALPTSRAAASEANHGVPRQNEVRTIKIN